MAYEELISLLLDSIQIIGIFLAIVVSLVMSKIINIKIEQNELKEKITDLNKEIEVLNQSLKDKENEIGKYRTKYKDKVTSDNENTEITNAQKIIENIQDKVNKESVYSLEDIFEKIITRDINDIMLEIKTKKLQKSISNNRLKSINKVTEIELGIGVFVVVSILSIIVPFLIVLFKNYCWIINNIIFKYLLYSFIASFSLLIIYVIYIYKKDY